MVGARIRTCKNSQQNARIVEFHDELVYPDEAFAALADFQLLVGKAKTRACHELLRATPFKPRCKTFRSGDNDESISQQTWLHSSERVSERHHGRRISRRC